MTSGKGPTNRLRLVLLTAFAVAMVYTGATMDASSSESGKARLYIKFKQYENPKNTLIDGHHCDPDFQGKPLSACDPKFLFEFLKEGGNGVPLLSLRQEDYYENTGNVKFGDTIGKLGLPNPPTTLPLMRIEKETRHGRNFLIVRVEDHDENQEDELMDIFVHMLEATTQLQNVTIVSKATGNKLIFEYRYDCQPGFHGQRCLKFCEGRNDESNGHYACSSEGEKLCLEGWTNVDKDCKVPSWCIWC